MRTTHALAGRLNLTRTCFSGTLYLGYSFLEHGMLVNPQKSVIVHALHGKVCRSWCRNKNAKTSKGSFLILWEQLRSKSDFQCRAQMVYLGVFVSYSKYELQTMKHRLHTARASRQRLIQVLHSSRHLSVKQRIELYNARVCSSSLYGVAAVGLTPACRAEAHPSHSQISCTP